MSDAALQKVLVCVPGGFQYTTGGRPMPGPCPEGYGFGVQEAYLWSGPGLPRLDESTVFQVFGIGFGIVILFFLVGRGVGEVLSLIRRG